MGRAHKVLRLFYPYGKCVFEIPLFLLYKAPRDSRTAGKSFTVEIEIKTPIV